MFYVKYPGWTAVGEDYQLVEYDPHPPPLPPGWHEQVMAAIRRIGPLKKHSSTSDEPTGSF